MFCAGNGVELSKEDYEDAYVVQVGGSVQLQRLYVVKTANCGCYQCLSIFLQKKDFMKNIKVILAVFRVFLIKVKKC